MRVIIAKLQEALYSGTRVLWALSIVTVRKTHDQTTSLQPFALSSCNKLINNALCVVGEITELRLPDGQRAGPLQAVAILETQDRVLGQRTVEQLEARLGRVQVVQADMTGAIFCVRQDEMAMGERSARHILSAQAHRMSVLKQGPERQGFAQRPGDSTVHTG